MDSVESRCAPGSWRLARAAASMLWPSIATGAVFRDCRIWWRTTRSSWFAKFTSGTWSLHCHNLSILYTVIRSVPDFENVKHLRMVWSHAKHVTHVPNEMIWIFGPIPGSARFGKKIWLTEFACADQRYDVSPWLKGKGWKWWKRLKGEFLAGDPGEGSSLVDVLWS